MEYLLAPLVEHLQKQLPWASFVDEDYGQLENIDDQSSDMYALTYPALLLAVERVDWEYLQGHVQKGQVQLRVRLVLDCYDDTHHTAYSGQHYERSSLSKLQSRAELRAQMHEALHLFRVQGDGGLRRTQSRYFTWHHGLKVYEETYMTTVTEPQGKGSPKLRLQHVHLEVDSTSSHR